MGANSLPKSVPRQRRDCDLNPGPSVPESSTLTSRLPSHPLYWVVAENTGLQMPATILFPGGGQVSATFLRDTLREDMIGRSVAYSSFATAPGARDAPHAG